MAEPKATTPTSASKESKDTRTADGDPQDNAHETNKNPSALDVIETLIDPTEEEKASVFMKGHISKSAIEDTFLFEA